MSDLRLLLLALVAALAMPALVSAQSTKKADQDEAPEEELDRLSLAALLVRDQHYDRADAVLAEVDLEDPETDLARFYLLRGFVRLAADLPAEAAADFAASIAQGNEEPGVHIQLARAWQRAREPRKAADALIAGGPLVADRPGTWLLRARIHKELEEWDVAAWALTEGAARFPAELELERQGVLLRVELGLYQEAAEAGHRWLERAGDEVDSWLVLAQAFLRRGRTGEAILLLEEAQLRFPDDIAVTKQLAGTWLAEGKPLAAGNLLRVAAELDATLYEVAAECFRRAGHIPTALQLNGQVPNSKEQARQRLGLLVEAEDFERASSLGPRLSRLGLLDDASVRYGLAYAAFRSGDHERSDELLAGISDPAVFQLAVRLREAIASCQEDSLGCL